jgi:putative endonuclease
VAIVQTRPSSLPHDRRSARSSLGSLGEDLAAAHLKRRGYAVLARNVRTRAGEIDLIACAMGVIVFAEVKTRRVRRAAANRPRAEFPQPLEAIGTRKQLQVRRLAAAWLAQSSTPRPRTSEIRFDAIAVTVDGHDRLVRLDHIEGAW